MRRLIELRWSLLAFAVSLILGLLSTGSLGTMLYYACYPLLGPFYGNPDDWYGVWNWPARILAGMVWSLGFLAAGIVDLLLKRRGGGVVLRGLAYLAVLWLAAALIWAILLLSMWVPPAEARKADAIACGELNRTYVEKGLAAVFGERPRLIDGSRCLKSVFSSDIFAMAELAADSAPDDAEFQPFEAVSEAPLDFTRSIYPEIFADLPLNELVVASGFSRELRVNVHLLRMKDGRLFVFVSDFL